MSVSHWKRTLAGDRLASVDVCVIGAGITGLAAADAISQLGRSAAVVEQHTVGWGASTRNAGYLMRGMAESYAEIADTLGRDVAQRVWADTEANQRLLLDRFDAGSLASLQHVPSVLVAMSDAERELLERSAAMMREDGFDVELRESGEDSLWRALTPPLALVNPGDMACNSAELLERVASTVRVRTPIFEGAEVFAFEDCERGVRVRTSRGFVDAERVIVCTNAYAGALLEGVAGRVVPNRGQMVAIRAPGVTLDASYYLDGGSEYIRQAHDGTIVVGGMRKHFEAHERTTSAEPTSDVQAALEDFAERVLGTRGEVVARWAGTMGFTADGLPIVEAVGVEGVDADRVWFCGGFTGHGMSLGVVTAQRAVDRMFKQA